MTRTLKKIILLIIAATAFSASMNGQFKEEAFSQNYDSSNTPSQTDSVDTMFSFAEFFGGVSHKRNVRIGVLFGGSTVFWGSQQIYNKQYWKLPVVYGGIGAGLGLGIYYKTQYNSSVKAYNEAVEINPETTLTINEDLKKYSNLAFAGAALTWWGMLMDGTVNYKKGDKTQHPGRATIYSILLPGLGQIYNHEYWKIPIYWGVMAGSLNYYSLNNTNYKRYKRIYNEATDPDISYSGPISADAALYYRNVFRRYRDWCAVALFLSYMLNVIDADVFSYMMDFEVTDDISLNIEPSFIPAPMGSAYAFTTPPSIGLGLKLNF